MTAITITLNQIKNYNPCKNGWEKVLKVNGGVKADFDKPFPVSSILESNGLQDTIWVLRCLPEYGILWSKFAWWCANEVAHLSNDERVSECLDVVYDYTEGKATKKELLAARAAADAADAAAAYAAYTAAAERKKQESKLREILDSGVFKK